jgi:hypothetical protein
MESEMRRLRLELKQTMDMYSSACREALTAKQKVLTVQTFFDKSLNLLILWYKSPSFIMNLSVYLKIYLEAFHHSIIQALFSFSSDWKLIMYYSNLKVKINK